MCLLVELVDGLTEHWLEVAVLRLVNEDVPVGQVEYAGLPAFWPPEFQSLATICAATRVFPVPVARTSSRRLSPLPIAWTAQLLAICW
jgi:hypothetical protein